MFWELLFLEGNLGGKVCVCVCFWRGIVGIFDCCFFVLDFSWGDERCIFVFFWWWWWLRGDLVFGGLGLFLFWMYCFFVGCEVFENFGWVFFLGLVVVFFFSCFFLVWGVVWILELGFLLFLVLFVCVGLW